ncbi:MAG TPA: hypothetical protein VHC46_03500 [Thermodesulfobacteriota bacterium]|nr:hypothetical protein [Thermodesulfobacteriota bacterium]
MKRNHKIAFIMLLVLCVGIMAAYILQLQQYSDDKIDTAEEAAESVNAAAATSQQTVSPQSTATPSPEDVERLQQGRKKIMDEMVDGGIAERIENPAGEPFVYVKSPFYGLSMEEQSSLMRVIFNYYSTIDGNVKSVTIYDDQNGQEIGSYSKAGLKMKGE